MEKDIKIIKSVILNDLNEGNFRKPIYSIGGFYRIILDNEMTLYCFKSIIYKFSFPGSYGLKYKWDNFKYESTKVIDIDIVRKLDEIFNKLVIPISDYGKLGKIKFWFLFYKNGFLHKFTEKLMGK